VQREWLIEAQCHHARGCQLLSALKHLFVAQSLIQFTVLRATVRYVKSQDGRSMETVMSGYANVEPFVPLNICQPEI
jgi:hypothetical protein